MHYLIFLKIPTLRRKWCYCFTCYPSELPIPLPIEIIRNQPRYVRTDAVADHVQVIRPYSPRVLSQVSDQLRHALGAKSGRPFHLAQAGFLDKGAVVHDEDVVVARMEEGIPHVGTGGEVATPAEAVDYNFCRMCAVVVAVVEGLVAGGVDDFGVLLGSPVTVP